jgi:hypothetical protein
MLGKRFREDEEGLLHENHSGITVRPAEFHEPALQSWLVKTSLMLFCANFHVIYGGKLRNVWCFFVAGKWTYVSSLRSRISRIVTTGTANGWCQTPCPSTAWSSH